MPRTRRTQGGDALLLAVGARIRALREARGGTQEQFAWAAGVSKSYMSEIEAGTKQLSLSVLALIADELGVEPWTLLVAPADPRAGLLALVLELNERELRKATALLVKARTTAT